MPDESGNYKIRNGDETIPRMSNPPYGGVEPPFLKGDLEGFFMSLRGTLPLLSLRGTSVPKQSPHRDCHASLAMTPFVIARHMSDEAIPVVGIRLPRFARNDVKGARNDRGELLNNFRKGAHY